MILRSILGPAVDLTVTGYQFPGGEPSRDREDSNWVNVSLEVASSVGSWTTAGAWLMTWEVEELVEWLGTVARGEVPGPLGFVEPNLAFETRGLFGEEAHVRVLFELEARPHWVQRDRTSHDVWVDLLLPPAGLSAAADELHVSVEQYPVRGASLR